MRIGSLFSFDGKVDRKTYAIVGLIGIAIKQNLDRLVGVYVFHYEESFFNYWRPLGKAARLNHLTNSEARFLLVLLLLAIPFMWVGVAMTVRRLRDAGRPLWLVSLFFVPFLNLIFFIVLCALPPKDMSPENEAAPWPSVRSLGGVIPRGPVGSALLSILLTTSIGLFFVLVGTKIIGTYGWGLFVALPFCLGMFSVLVYSYHEQRGFSACMGVSALPVVILGGVMIAVAIEGLICVLMAAPLGIGLAMLGGALGHGIQTYHWGQNQKHAALSIAMFAVPVLFGMENAAALKPPVFAVHSTIEINAPPERVWKKVVAFTEIAPPTEMIFRAGIAYPIRAEITGSGPGAVRHCVFSTGAFVEPIEVWDEPRLLRFSVSQNPPPLEELTPYAHIDPPHLHGYFASHEGQFLLTALPGGRTQVEGTTWYSHTMWPAAYWHVWSDYVIHRIHMRVLEHIRAEVERPE
jgi:uncharacterized membrane protein YhaH (DUF805 family)